MFDYVFLCSGLSEPAFIEQLYCQNPGQCSAVCNKTSCITKSNDALWFRRKGRWWPPYNGSTWQDESKITNQFISQSNLRSCWFFSQSNKYIIVSLHSNNYFYSAYVMARKLMSQWLIAPFWNGASVDWFGSKKAHFALCFVLSQEPDLRHYW